MYKKIDSTDSCLMALVFGIALVVGGLLVNGWAISMLWGWFISPLFNANQLTIANAIGLSCFVSMFSLQSNKKDSSDLTETAVRTLLSPLVIVFMGWIVSFWMAAQ